MNFLLCLCHFVVLFLLQKKVIIINSNTKQPDEGFCVFYCLGFLYMFLFCLGRGVGG